MSLCGVDPFRHFPLFPPGKQFYTTPADQIVCATEITVTPFMQIRTRFILSCLGWALLLSPFLPWIADNDWARFIASVAGLLILFYARSILKPCFPQPLDKQNPLFARIAVAAAATSGTIIYVFFRQHTPARVTLYVCVAILVLGMTIIDLKFLLRVRTNVNGPGDNKSPI